jgi:hypothetical protein
MRWSTLLSLVARLKTFAGEQRADYVRRAGYGVPRIVWKLLSLLRILYATTPPSIWIFYVRRATVGTACSD